ncbi:MAG: hypothetical protein R2761_23185 [Acidimicrobiales bacterium]
MLHVALGDTDDIVVRMPVGEGAEVLDTPPGDLELPIEPGFTVLAMERNGRYLYRPRKHVTLRAGDHGAGRHRPRGGPGGPVDSARLAPGGRRMTTSWSSNSTRRWQ